MDSRLGARAGPLQLKLLLLFIISLFLGDPVPMVKDGKWGLLAQVSGTRTSSFEFDLETGRPVRFEQNSDGWDLVDHVLGQSMKNLAFQEFSSLASRASPKNASQQNRALVADLITNLSPQLIQLKTPEKSTASDRNIFIESWMDYRARFVREYEQLQAQLAQSRYASTAAVYFSEKMIRSGLAMTLKDPEFQAQIESVIKDLALNLSKTQTVHINDEFNFTLLNQKVVNQVKAQTKVSPIWDSRSVHIRSEIGATDAKIFFSLTLRGFKVEIPEFEIVSNSLSQTVSAHPDDGFELEFTLDESKPVTGEISVIWNAVTNLPDLVIDRSRIKTPLDTLSLKRLKFRDRVFDTSSQRFTDWLAHDGWGAAYQVLTDKKFTDQWIGMAKDYIQNELSRLTSIDKTIYVFMKEGPLKIDEQGNAESPYRAMAADPANPLTEDMRSMVVAKFHLRVDFKLSLVSLDTNFSSTTAQAAPKMKLSISSPRARVSDLRIYVRGQPLDLGDMGLDVSLIAKEASEIQAQLGGEIDLQGQSQIGISPIQSNFEILGIENFKFRMGSQIMETSDPSIALLLRQMEFVRAKIVSKDLRSKQPQLGIDLQTKIVGELETQFASRLASTKIQIGPLKDDSGRTTRPGLMLNQTMDLWAAKIKATVIGQEGYLEFPNIRLQNIQMHFQDQSANSPVCKGTYLISGDTQLGISEPMVIRGKDLKFGLTTTVAGISKTVNIKARGVLAQVHQLDGEGQNSHSELHMSFDICYVEGAENLDIRVRSYDHNLDRIIFEDLDVHGVDVDSQWLNQVSGILGYGSSKTTSRDEKISSLLQDIFIQQQKYISLQIAEQLKDFFGKVIPKYLNSPEVKNQLEQGIAKVDQAGHDAKEYASNIGVNLKEPIELAINSEIKNFVQKEIMPQVRKQVDGRRQTLDTSVIQMGRWMGADIEELLYSRLIDALYGRASRRALSVNLERMITPLSSQRILLRDFEFEFSNPFEDLRAEVRRTLHLNSILTALDSCPFENAEHSLQKLSRAMSEDRESLDSEIQETLLKFISQRCNVNDPTFTLGPAYLKEFYERGVKNLNELLVSESVKQYTVLPGSRKLPMLQGSDQSPEMTRMLRAHGIEPDFQTTWSVAGIELLRDPQPVFRVLMRSPQFSNTMMGLSSDVPAPVLKTIAESDQNFVIRAPGSTINQILLKVDWVTLIQSKLGADYRVEMSAAPRVNASGGIDFTARIETTLLGIVDVDAKLTGSLPFRVRMVKSQDGVVAQVEFSKLRLDALEAPPIVDAVVRSKTSDLDQVLEKGINLALSELGTLPKVSWLSNGFQIEDLLFSDGDFYLVAKRFDWPGESKLALKR